MAQEMLSLNESKEKNHLENLQKLIQNERLSILHFIYMKLLCTDSAATFFKLPYNSSFFKAWGVLAETSYEMWI